MKILTPCFLALALLSCSNDRQSTVPGPSPTPPAQGLVGTVEFWEGDFMLTPYPDIPSGSVTPVERTVYIYEPTTNADVVMDTPGGFFSEIHTQLIDTVRSNDAGYFSIDLRTGTYSLFVGEDDRFYANLWSDSYIQPVTIEQTGVTEVTITIDYLATY